MWEAKKFNLTGWMEPTGEIPHIRSVSPLPDPAGIRRDMLRDEISRVLKENRVFTKNSPKQDYLMQRSITDLTDAIMRIPELAEDHQIAEAWRSQNANPGQEG